jgi:ferritin-like metal-binding protein YciE
MDAALIGAARRVEHYEIAAYSTVIKFAELLGQDEAIELLEQTLEEESETDEKLVGFIEDLSLESSAPSETAEEEETANVNQKKSRSARA